jgi:hypothetical protein
LFRRRTVAVFSHPIDWNSRPVPLPTLIVHRIILYSLLMATLTLDIRRMANGRPPAAEEEIAIRVATSRWRHLFGQERSWAARQLRCRRMHRHYCRQAARLTRLTVSLEVTLVFGRECFTTLLVALPGSAGRSPLMNELDRRRRACVQLPLVRGWMPGRSGRVAVGRSWSLSCSI